MKNTVIKTRETWVSRWLSQASKLGANAYRYRMAYVLILPAALIVALVSIYPLIYAIWQSFYEVSYLQTARFVGIGNFVRLLRDPALPGHILASILFVGGSLIVGTPLALALSVILNRDIHFKAMFRAVLILPWVVSQVATALIWGWIVNPQYGPINYLCLRLGLGKIDVLGKPISAVVMLILANVWRTFPYSMVLFLAALQVIPKELDEAAYVDGASAWRVFWNIKIPLMRATIMNTLIIQSLDYFNTVTLILLLTGGGPIGVTDTLALRTFREGFQFWNTGYAAALGVVIFVFNIIISLFYLRTLRLKSNV